MKLREVYDKDPEQNRLLNQGQVLRGSAKPLQSWKHERTPLATELLLELVDREAAVMPFPLEDAEGDQAADEVMDLRPLRACLTAAQLELICTDPDHFFNLGAEAIPSADLGRRQRAPIGGQGPWRRLGRPRPSGHRSTGLAPPHTGGADRLGGAAR